MKSCSRFFYQLFLCMASLGAVGGLLRGRNHQDNANEQPKRQRHLQEGMDGMMMGEETTPAPTTAPTPQPTTLAPVMAPTPFPTATPSARPTRTPSASPTDRPTTSPSHRPTQVPSSHPTVSFVAPCGEDVRVESPTPRTGRSTYRFFYEMNEFSGSTVVPYHLFYLGGSIVFENSGTVVADTGDRPPGYGEATVAINGNSNLVEVTVETLPVDEASEAYWIMRMDCF
ncbi:hypothetical protein ACA910_004352 [Epithemia clementina (nom. ined.)]